MNKEVIQRPHVYLQVQRSAREGNRRKLISENILQFTLIRINTEPMADCCQFCLCELKIALTVPEWLGRRLKNNILRDVKIACNFNFCVDM